ncbi:MAG: RecQ family ATP-dependent DNA helicase [Cyanobacteriota bacterium]|nr:RecQ family ATP-dependent DNA helicase [Cyanobacteriota bacterium]
MTENKVLELAKQCDVWAIASLLNTRLQPQGIVVKISLSRNEIAVILESNPVPKPGTEVDFIFNTIKDLGIESLEELKVCGWQTGSKESVWQKQLKLKESIEPETTLNSPYVFVDLEVSLETKNIYRIGWLAGATEEDIDSNNLDLAYQQLKELKEKGLKICGHNFRRFDYSYLIKAYPELEPWEAIDTLELSILTFPLELSHKLNKQYKESEEAANNPLEDARETQQLLDKIIAELRWKLPSLQQVYSWLLTCGNSDADKAYRQFFDYLEFPSREEPEISQLPEAAITGIELSELEQLCSEAKDLDFDRRLSLAALISWNYEKNITAPNSDYPAWLNYLPGFENVLGKLQILPNFYSYLERFKIENFRGKQKEAIAAIYRRQRPLIVMATGSGKSLCYQLIALMLFEEKQALTIVVSPLQALMADQVRDLETQNINFATFINGNISVNERASRLEELKAGNKGLLYISPEQLRSPTIRLLLQQQLPAFWVIDEAHCISEWGHDFRPDYRYLPKFLQELYEERPQPLLALTTATATVKVQTDIKTLFASYNLEINNIISDISNRPNLDYQVISSNGRNKEQIVLQEVEKYLQEGGSAIVYTATRKNAQKLSERLNQADIEARYYHGKLPKGDKQEVLQEFKAGNLNAVVATCAFGMGINRPDVRAVIHHSMSHNLEAYMQETGRAGRDGSEATCLLLFDEQDAETIFYLQSQMQLSQADLKNIFLSARSISKCIHKKQSGEWFWATVNEIFQTGELGDNEFASAPEYRDIKIKVALQHLENFGLLERAENLSAYIRFELVDETEKESQKRLKEYCRQKNISRSKVKPFFKLIKAMHLTKAYYTEKEEPVPLDRLSDESGINPKDLPRSIRSLQKAGVASAKIPLSFLLNKEIKGDAKTNFNRIRGWQEQLLELLLEIQEKKESVRVNLRILATRLDPQRKQKIRAGSLRDILEGWKALGWIQLTVNRDFAGIKGIDAVADNLGYQQELAEAVIEVLYEKLSAKKGTRLLVGYELELLLENVNKKIYPRTIDEKELSAILLWLHQRKLLRLTEGSNLFHQALKIKVIKGARETSIGKGYQELKDYYAEQNRRTHLMMKYGRTADSKARQKLVEDYFNLSEKQFNKVYSDLAKADAKLPIIPSDYDRIMGDINAAQKEIVLAENPALLVIAGPGSGKTRTIVRRIAYLVKVKRVDPSRILVLAYNRNAVGELRLRLQELIGAIAARLRVFTFHGLGLAILGWAPGQQLSTDREFKQLLKEACDLMEEGDELDAEDSQARRLQLLGNVDYIFVDEYQDVAEDEYKLIKLIAGLGDSEDESRSVQINLCVIGDDDQNIYEFRGTSSKYIQQFEEEYRAKRFLLTENYRSTEAIINAANNVIKNNPKRCKSTPAEQVKINSDRPGKNCLPVGAFSFKNSDAQAAWVTEKIISWRREGVAANEIAVIARQWDNLSPIRLLLETNEIPTYALKSGKIKLVRNLVASRLIDELNGQLNLVLSPEESVRNWFVNRFEEWHRSKEELTVKVLLKIAEDLDRERGYGFEDLAVPITAAEVAGALLEFNNSEILVEDDSVLVTSCHGAKGLEFKKVVLLTDNFNSNVREIESERRLFYVAMTRAKEELVLCSTGESLFAQETGVSTEKIAGGNVGKLPAKTLYLDLTPRDIYLAYPATSNKQEVIINLREGDRLQLRVNRYGNSWAIFTEDGVEIGNLSKNATADLKNKGIAVKQFEFLPGEVTVKSIYHHLKIDDMTGEITEDWFAVLPQIRVCR